MSQTPQPPQGRRRRKEEESQTYQPALFEELITEDYGHKVRRRWYQDRWWFSILDIIAIAADTTAPGKYWYALKQRMEKEQGFQSTLAQIEVLRIPAKDGRLRETDMATDETILRILQKELLRSPLPLTRHSRGFLWIQTYAITPLNWNSSSSRWERPQHGPSINAINQQDTMPSKPMLRQPERQPGNCAKSTRQILASRS